MGWCSCDKPSWETASEFIKRTVLTWDDDCPSTYRVLDSGIVKFRTFYAAVEQIDKATGAREVWAAVVLLSYSRADGCNFGWKSMSEASGPCEDDCPARILDLLTPTESEYAAEWRARCRAKIAARRNRPPVGPGVRVTLYRKGFTLVQSLGRRGWEARGDDGNIYRIKSTQIAKCEIIDAAAVAAA